ncbi:hypothetical protein ACTPOE_05905 [Castellaniella sp. WN]
MRQEAERFLLGLGGLFEAGDGLVQADGPCGQRVEAGRSRERVGA